MDARSVFLKQITEAFGPPGMEDEVAAILRERVAHFCEVSRDNIGSFIAEKKGSAEGPRIMVAGHMDEVAWMVTDLESGGYLRIRPLGGWWPHVMLGQRVIVRTAKGSFLGIIGSKPPHELKEDERKKVLDWDDIFVDLGAAENFDVLEATGVRRGDFVVPHAPYETLVNEKLSVVKAWDNRVGCALATDLLRELKDQDHPNTVFGVATVQEEIGLRGADTSAYSVKPDIAFAVDVGLALDTPGSKKSEKNPERLGSGVSILLLEGRAVAHPRLARFVMDVAEEEKIPYHATSLGGGSTDANRFQVAGAGVPSVAICVPSRYIHSHSSLIHRDDYDSALALLTAVTKRLDEETVRKIRGG
ncbi:MAG: M42 family metallopeptidase [Deltaproteobacteria bacterium]|nr:M42 family metallopeptidase [Deltaproteobacteria bacterium]